MRKAVAALAVLTSLSLLACSSNDDTASDDGDETTTTGEALTGPSPGVTDDTIKIGITYLDLESIKEIVDLDQGKFEESYQAVIDQINDEGGIHGRMLEPVYAPISPIQPASAEEACVRLTEDEDVFVMVGYFQDDTVLCPVSDHETAVIGGNVTEARNDEAKAPWFTVEPGEDEEIDVVKVMAEEGDLDGKLGVFATILNEGDMNDVYLPLLEDLDIDVVDSAVLDAPFDDATAQNQATAVIAERFESEGIDTILAIGGGALPLANGLTPLDYRPALRAPNQAALSAYVYGANPDQAIVDSALVGGTENGEFDEELMQDCLGTLVDAGVEPEFEDPDDIPKGERTPYNAAVSACRQIPLLKAILEAAGEDLNYGTFRQAGESLSVQLPGATEEYHFGPYPENDGEFPMSVFKFSDELGYFVPADE
jgi:hypothetical protein